MKTKKDNFNEIIYKQEVEVQACANYQKQENTTKLCHDKNVFVENDNDDHANVVRDPTKVIETSLSQDVKVFDS